MKKKNRFFENLTGGKGLRGVQLPFADKFMKSLIFRLSLQHNATFASFMSMSMVDGNNVYMRY